MAERGPDLVVEGRIQVQNQYAPPAEGRGTISFTADGFTWRIKKFLFERSDGGRWREVHTFARQVSVLSLMWEAGMGSVAEPA